MSTSDELEEYEVEKIVEATVHWKRGKKIYWKYLVKWKGYDASENTWEQQEQLENAPLVVEEFWKSVELDGRDWIDGNRFKVGEKFEAGSALRSPSRRKAHQKQKDEEAQQEEEPSQVTSTSSQRRSARKRTKPLQDDDETRFRTTVKKEKRSVSSDEEEERPQPMASARKRGTARKSEARKPEPVEVEDVEEEPKPSPSKRGRPRKEEKTSISSDEEDEQPKSPTKKRGRPRTSVVKKERDDEPMSSRRPARAKKAAASDSEDDRPLRPRKKAKPTPVKSSTKAKAKRKAYESDDSGDTPPRVVPVSKGKTVMTVDIPVRRADVAPKPPTEEVDSPGGSLFSGDEDAEGEDDVPLPATTEASMPPPSGSVPKDRGSSVISTGDPNIMRRSMSLDRSNQKAGSPAAVALPAHRQRAANPLVKRLEDPELSAAIEDRLKVGRASGAQVANPPPTESNAAAASSSSAPAPFVSKEKPFLTAPKPALLTFTKGKLTSHRPKAVAAPRLPPAGTTSTVEQSLPAPKQPEAQQTPLANTALDGTTVLQSTASDHVAPNGSATDNVPVGEHDDPLGMDVDGHFELDVAENNDDELLLQPANLQPLINGTDGGEDLPDFEDGQLFNSDEIPPLFTSIEDGELREPLEHSAPVGSAPVAEASTSVSPSTSVWEPTSLLAGPSTSTAWKQSTIFGLATPPVTAGTYSYVPFEPTSGDPVIKSNKFGLDIPLDPSRRIPVLLKDVSPATYDTTSRLTDLLGGTPTGPPGKLYDSGVLQLMKKGGTCARITLDDDASPDHKNHFNQLRLELEDGKVFIVVLGAITVVLFSSQNIAVGNVLLVPDNLLGLSKTLIMSHIAVESAGEFVKFAMEATDLKLV